MKSPPFASRMTVDPAGIWPSATSAATGCMKFRWTVRFSSRAPNSVLIPFSRSRLRPGIRALNLEAAQTQPMLDQLGEVPENLIKDDVASAARQRLIGDHGIDTVDKFGGKLLANRRHSHALKPRVFARSASEEALLRIRNQVWLHAASTSHRCSWS